MLICLPNLNLVKKKVWSNIIWYPFDLNLNKPGFLLGDRPDLNLSDDEAPHVQCGTVPAVPVQCQGTVVVDSQPEATSTPKEIGQLLNKSFGGVKIVLETVILCI